MIRAPENTKTYQNKEKRKKNIPNKQNKENMQPDDQVTAFDPESPELKALRQSAISWGHSDFRGAEAGNPQKHGAQNKTVNRITR